MQGNAKSAMKNVALFAGLPPSPMPGVGGQDKYTGKQFEYFENPTTAYIWDNAQYAANYFKAKVQGIIPGTFETERGAYIRSMDIVEQTTGAKMPNDYQAIYFQDTRIKGLYTGAKVKYAGNTWLAISPFNISDPLSSAVIRRCNAVWKHLDYYGNVLSEPFVFHDGRASATANEYLDYDVIPNWYQKCVMQLNDETRELAYNRRMVLGTGVVQLRGIVDFVSDFTGETKDANKDPEPSHVLFFDVQMEQPNEYDDMERGIANGKAFSWVLDTDYSGLMNVGGTQQIVVTSWRNGELPDTANHPVSYLFSSSDSSIVSVDDDGVVTANALGHVTITVALEQNPEITTEVNISVESAAITPIFQIEPTIPSEMRQMQTYSGKVKVVQAGAEISTPITVSTSGADDCASVALDSNTNTLTIDAYEPSDSALIVTMYAENEGLYQAFKIRLEGF